MNPFAFIQWMRVVSCSGSILEITMLFALEQMARAVSVQEMYWLKIVVNVLELVTEWIDMGMLSWNCKR